MLFGDSFLEFIAVRSYSFIGNKPQNWPEMLMTAFPMTLKRNKFKSVGKTARSVERLHPQIVPCNLAAHIRSVFLFSDIHQLDLIPGSKTTGKHAKTKKHPLR